ncbi:MAG: tetratricopeptide repeat protein, partial [Armatimonadetes bacterium]|nr:tetratricopeptide repeat protein [Armatimonadota bacterium]
LRQAEDPFTFARLAELLHSQGRLVEARSLCEQALARYPDYVRVRLTMAQIAEGEGDLERAEAELRMVLRAEPHNRVCRVGLGRLLLSRGALAEAMQHLEHALFLSPGDAGARDLLARARAQAVSVPAKPARAGAAPAAAEAGSPLEQALDLVAETHGVTGVLLVDRSGLLIDQRGAAGIDADVASATLHETWNAAQNYVVRMRLGMLRVSSIFASERVLVLAPCNPGLLAVAAEPSAKLGLINRRVETARNLLVNA